MATSTVDDDIVSVEAACAATPRGSPRLYRRHVGGADGDPRQRPRRRGRRRCGCRTRSRRRSHGSQALREPERFRPWLLQIARNTAIDHRRVRRRMEFDDNAETEDLADDGLGPDGHVELNDLAALVNH